MLTVVDLGVSNLGSLTSALRFIGATFEVTSEAYQVRAATAILLPGVGAVDPAVAAIDERGFRGPLLERVGSGVPILGICLGMQLLFEGSDEGEHAALGLLPGRAARLGLTPDAKVPHVGFATVVHPSVFLGPSVAVGDGCIAAPGSMITCDVRLGRGAIVNYGANVGHDCAIADSAFIGPGAMLTGDVRIGEGSLVGAGAVILPGRTVGSGAVVGAGAVVTKDVTARETVVGSPAKQLPLSRHRGGE